MPITYAEFKDLMPDSSVAEAAFNRLLMQAEAVINDMVVYCYCEMSEKQQTAYNKALALQVDYFGEVGVTGDGLTHQTINGTSMTFSGSEYGSANISCTALTMLRNAGLTARAYGWY